jgi:MFS family permease
MPRSKRSAAIGAVGMAVGGLAPMITGIVGIYGYLTEGYFVSKSGEVVTGPVGWIASIFFILAGLGMMALAVRLYRRHTRPEA